MKLVIIGGGNMGGAIARGLLQGSIFKTSDVVVIDVNIASLEVLRQCNPDIRTATNYNSVPEADIILLSVKPWLINEVIEGIKSQMDYSKQILISIAAGVSISDMMSVLEKPLDATVLPVVFRIIPNTAIAVKQSMTLITSNNALPEQEKLILQIFNELGNAILLDENKLDAGTALTSCGIAYLFRYVRAAMQAGVEMGFYPKDAREMVVNTMLGAAGLLKANQTNPEVEIDKVTTPGGITIKGLNELDANGFSNAIIKAHKASRRNS